MQIEPLLQNAQQVLNKFKFHTYQPEFCPQNLAELAPLIDHTLLKPVANEKQIQELCKTAVEQGFYAVCVNSVWAKRAALSLANFGVKLAVVVGFPLGASHSASKAFEAKQAVMDGATELDMVLSIGQLKAGDHQAVFTDIQKVVEAATAVPVKVILETGLLTELEIVTACLLAKAAGAKFVKTSTGFLGGGATVDAVRLMHCAVGDALQIKASGGIRSLQTARLMIMAGANRIGASQISE